MPQCPNIDRCPLFPLFRHEGVLAAWKLEYCEHSAHRRCERIRCAQAGERPPDALLPNGALLPILQADAEPQGRASK